MGDIVLSVHQITRKENKKTEMNNIDMEKFVFDFRNRIHGMHPTKCN